MLLSSLLGALALIAPPIQEGGPPPSNVRAARAVERTVVPRHLVTGSLRPAFEARVGAREAGALQKVNARAGRRFAQGDVLAELDGARLAAERAAAAAARAEAAASHVSAKAEHDAAAEDLRATELAAERGAVSQRDLRDARARALSARAGVEAAAAKLTSADANLALMDVRLRDARVLAPFDGVVVEELVEVGEWVVPGTAICVLVSDRQLEATLDVPERLLPSAQHFGESLEVALRATDTRLLARNVRTVPRIDTGARSFRVMADVELADGAAAGPGMSISAYLPGGAPQAYLMVPKDALVYRPSGLTVTVVLGADEGQARMDGTAMPRAVEIAFEVDREVALRAGALAAGEVVVVEGNERLFPGSPVAATIDAPAGAGR